MAVRTAQPRSPKVPEIRKGDTVVVLAGKDAGKRGKVERVIRRAAGAERRAAASSAAARPRAASSVVVEGLNIAKRHTKPRQSAGHDRPRCPKIQQGGILDIAQPLPISKVMLVCAQLRQADPDRARDARHRPPRPRLPPLRRAAGGEVVTSRLHERYTAEVVPGAPEAVRVRQPEPGAAARRRSSSTSASARR